MSSVFPGRARQRRLARRRVAGLTLVELMLALAAVSVLVALAMPTYSGYRDRALAADAATDIRGLSVMAKSYRAEFGHYPSQIADAIDNVVETDPWGAAYQYQPIEGEPNSVKGKVRKDKNLVPINSDFDLYSVGPDGESQPPLTAKASHDDIVRASNGAFVGFAEDY